MNDPRQPRRLNTNTASGRAPASSSGRKINRNTASNGEARTTYRAPSNAGASRNANTQQRSGNVYRANNVYRAGTGMQSTAQPRNSQQNNARRAAPNKPRKKKGNPLKVALLSLFSLLMVLCIGLFGVYQWVVRSISPEGGTPTISQLINTPDEFKGDVVNILVCGIDYEEGRAYSNDPTSNDGMTDMIMYVNFDVKNKKINMLQIPRDTFAGNKYSTGGTGKINAIALKNDGVSTLAQVISEQYKLPIDYYITINMQSLKEIVDLFGGIEVYIPHEVADGKGSYLPAGLHNLNGDSAEFLVRNRHGSGYAQGDIARLDMQRYFYQGLFKRIRTATVWDLAKLMPVVLNYITTDIPGNSLVSLGVSFLKVDSADIMMCKVPTYNAAQYYNGNAVQVCDTTKTLDLINTYFMTYGTPVSSLDVPTLPTAGSSTDANVQYMGQLDNQADSDASDAA